MPVAHGNIAADLDIPVRYDMAFAAKFSGTDGSDGMDGSVGTDGMAGTDGTPATTDSVSGATTL
ncbi:MAG: hypothetical protein ACREVO_01510 [Steroidobacteraceae bacterium]